jgi:hypothetical protein
MASAHTSASLLVVDDRANHRGAAIAVMVVSNGLLAVVAAHNASVLRDQR